MMSNYKIRKNGIEKYNNRKKYRYQNQIIFNNQFSINDKMIQFPIENSEIDN